MVAPCMVRKPNYIKAVPIIPTSCEGKSMFFALLQVVARGLVSFDVFVCVSSLSDD